MRRIALLAVGLAFAVGYRFSLLAPPSVSAAPPPAQADPWKLLLFATHANDPETELVAADASGAWVTLARFAHRPGAAVRGAALRDGRVLAVADRAPGSDRSWGSSLLRVEPGHGAVELCDRVDYASTPLVAGGAVASSPPRVLVSRGRSGEPRPGALREDELSIDEIDLTGGRARTVWQGRGYQAHLAGAWGAEAIVYLLTPGSASLMAVNLDTGRTRAVRPSLTPFARDFSIDSRGRLAYANRDEERHDLWVVDRVDLATGQSERLWRSSSQHLAPHVWPGGELALADGERGLVLSSTGLRAPAGDGVDVVRSLAEGGARAALWHYPPGGQLPDVVVVDARARPLAHLRAPEATRLEIIGFVGGAQ